MAIMTPVPTGAATPSTQGGLLRVMSRDQTLDAHRAESAVENMTRKSSEISGLVDFLDRVWERNSEHRDTTESISDKMLESLQSRNSEYSSEKKSAIEAEGGTPIFMGLTEVKCNHGEAWILDIFTSNEKSWGLEPTPVPDATPFVRDKAQVEVLRQIQGMLQSGQEVTSEQVQQMSEQIEKTVEQTFDDETWKRAKKMERKINDQLTEGGFHTAFEEFVGNLVALKAGILKGPVVRSHTRLNWEEQKDGMYTPALEKTRLPNFYSVSPMDFYPDPDTDDHQMGNIVETYDISRSELVALRDSDDSGYDAKAIDKILEGFDLISDGSGYTTEEYERDKLEKKDVGITGIGSSPDPGLRCSLQAKEFWVTAQGKTLRKHGRTKGPDGNPLVNLDEYEINAVMVDDQIIYLDFNSDPLLRRPYSVTGWNRVLGSFWYRGVPERMEALQQVCNASIRAMVRNMGVAAGPQTEVDIDRLPPGENIESVYPLKIWQTRNPGNSSAPAVRFFQANSLANELFSVYQNFAQLADDYTGIPAYAFGSDKVAGAGRTSSGLSMLMSASAKGIKRVILNIDMYVVQDIVKRMFDWNMQYDPDSSLKGDMQIKTTGAVALMAKEQMASRRIDFLNMTNNEVDLGLVGLENRANVLRETAHMLEIEGTEVVKDPEEIRDMVARTEGMQQQMQEQQAQLEAAKSQAEVQNIQSQAQLRQAQAQSEMAEVQLKMRELEIKAKEVEIKAAKLQLDAAQGQADSQVRALEAGTHARTQAQKVQASTQQNQADLEMRAVDAGTKARLGLMGAKSQGIKDSMSTMKMGSDLLQQGMENETPEPGRAGGIGPTGE